MRVPAKIIYQNVQNSLEEDLGSGDVTAMLLPSELKATAVILNRECLLLTGQPWVNAVFETVDSSLQVTWFYQEGDWVDHPTTLCKIEGSARSILTAERCALNWLQTLSGVSTRTYQYVQKLKPYSVKLLDTRKTIPGLRLAQKYAVYVAGGHNHRLGLYDAFLIKENHIKACGSISNAIKTAKNQQTGKFIEVEVQNLHELQEAIRAQPDRILLDNFDLEDINNAVQLNQNRCELELSGGINLHNLEAFAQTGIDCISVGDLTKSVQAIDLSLLIKDIHGG